LVSVNLSVFISLKEARQFISGIPNQTVESDRIPIGTIDLPNTVDIMCGLIHHDVFSSP
jgi:hypothetical protein